MRLPRPRSGWSPGGGGNAELIEVTGKADAHGGGDAGGRGKLVIHEIEFFRAGPRVTAPAQ